MPHVAVDSESGEKFSASEGRAGYTLLDPSRRKIGSIDRVFANGSGSPEYVQVKMGLFSSKTVLIPVSFATVDEERRTLTLE